MLEADWVGTTGALACIFPLQDEEARVGLVVVTPRRIDVKLDS